MADPLTKREEEILGLLARGLTNREIGEALFISPETVKWYNKQLYGKLQVSSRTQAVAKARQFGLLPTGKTTRPDAQRLPTHTLPLAITSFVGRERQIAEVKGLLQQARLVTLTGPGGTGKTRLAIEVANSALERYPEGVAFVALAAVDDPDLVPKAIAQTLDVVERPDITLVEAIQGALSHKQMLLVVDNFEHVLDAAGLVTDFLTAAPGLTILATSRERLRLSGEYEYPVPPLALPSRHARADLSVLSANESIALFEQRARAANPAFRLTEESGPIVAAICRRLDGLPLAIELAAALTKLLSPQDMQQRLEYRLGLLVHGPRDLPERQRTLRGTIDWSYHLLDSGEKTLFTRLAIFSGGRSIKAMESVCGPGLPIEVLDGLASLLDKSLLIQRTDADGELRFYLLETIHEYARERLEESGERTEMIDRHLAYYLSQVEEMEPGYRGRNQLLLLARTEVEMGNLRAAFRRALAKNDINAAARLVSSMRYYLYYGDHNVEGYRWIQQLLKQKERVAPVYRFGFNLAASLLADAVGESLLCRETAQQALEHARQQGNRVDEAWALIYLAASYIDYPEAYKQAVTDARAGLAIFQELNDLSGQAQALNVLGELVRTAGDYEQARSYYEACRDICNKSGEVIRQWILDVNLSFVDYRDREYASAKEKMSRVLKSVYGAGYRHMAAQALALVAGPLSMLGQPEKAARLLGASDARMADMSIVHQPGDRVELATYTADVRARLGDDAFEAAWAEGQAMRLEEAVAYALSEE